MNNRILPIDGLRAFAAFGVIWIHTWSYFGNPAIPVLSLDLYQLLAILGNGVDFFFVISGFCMYLMTRKKLFTAATYLSFLYKRFLRIAPAFYLAVLVYAALAKISNTEFAIGYNVFFHLLFLNNVVTGNTISGPFWSIGTEWHFYLVLPFFVYLSHKFSLVKAVIICSIASLVFFAIVNMCTKKSNFFPAPDLSEIL
ncbi:MAG: acyltransferase, partial [Sphingobacteriales bacterium]